MRGLPVASMEHWNFACLVRKERVWGGQCLVGRGTYTAHEVLLEVELADAGPVGLNGLEDLLLCQFRPVGEYTEASFVP